MIVRAEGAIWLNPLATVLFNVCIAVTVECCVLYPCCVGVFGTFAVMQGRRFFSSGFAITERMDMGLYEVPLSMHFWGFGMGTMLANSHICGIMLVLRAVFNMLVRNASPRGPVCFGCLMFSFSVPCELLFLLCFIASWDLSCGECDVKSLYFLCCSVNASVCLVCCVLDSVCELFVKLFTMCLGVVVILLLNVIEVFSLCGDALLDIPFMVFHRMCVLCLWSHCASKCSFHRFCFCMLEVMSQFKSLRAESQVFALLRCL